jgi:hypothetical protein
MNRAQLSPGAIKLVAQLTCDGVGEFKLTYDRFPHILYRSFADISGRNSLRPLPWCDRQGTHSMPVLAVVFLRYSTSLKDVSSHVRQLRHGFSALPRAVLQCSAQGESRRSWRAIGPQRREREVQRHTEPRTLSPRKDLLPSP